MDNCKDYAIGYVQSGLALVPIPFGKKGPQLPGWNTQSKCITIIEQAQVLDKCNIGLAHRYSHTCAIDIDHLENAETWFKDHGLDLMQYLAADDAVQIIREMAPGEPGRAKLIYKLPEGVEALPTRQLHDNGIEFRCADETLKKTVQDVLPPSTHPNGSQYRWHGLGDWKNLPTLPDKLLKLWQHLANKIKEGPKLGDNLTLQAIKDHSLYIRKKQKGWHDITCPWSHEHTGGSDIAGYIEAHTNGYAGESFKCFHTHCEHRTIKDLLQYLGLTDKTTDSVNDTGFQLSHISDVKSSMKPLTWLIKNILEQDVMAVIFGPAGAGKSFVAIDLCCHVAAGLDWHGHKVEQSQVIYIKGEGHNGFGRRIKAWEQSHKLNLSEYPFYASETAAQLYSLESALQVSEAIEAIMQDTSQPALIVIDTLARNFGPANENSTEDMNQFIDNIDQLIRSKFNATVVIVHHTGVMNKDRGRGSSALNAALDFEYKVEQPQAGIIQVQNTKTKDSEPPSPMAFNMVQVDTGLTDEDGLPVHSVVLEATEAIKKSITTGLGNKQKALLDLLQVMYEEHRSNLSSRSYPEKDARVLVQDWRERAVNEGLYPEKNSRQAFGKAKDRLEARKLITITGSDVVPSEFINE